MKKTKKTLNETFLSFNQALKVALARRTTYAKSVENDQGSVIAVLGSSRPEILTTIFTAETQSGLTAGIRLYTTF